MSHASDLPVVRLYSLWVLKPSFFLSHFPEFYPGLICNNKMCFELLTKLLENKLRFILDEVTSVSFYSNLELLLFSFFPP